MQDKKRLSPFPPPHLHSLPQNSGESQARQNSHLPPQRGRGGVVAETGGWGESGPGWSWMDSWLVAAHSGRDMTGTLGDREGWAGA